MQLTKRTDCLIAGIFLGLAGCATSHPPKTFWRNAVDPQRSYIGDDQECQVIANALTVNVFPTQPLYHFAANQAQWKRCMIGRNWRQVTLDSAQAKPQIAQLAPTGPLDPRWKKLGAQNGITIYLDTANVIRPAPNVLGVWTSYQYDTVTEISGTRVWKAQIRWDFDCSTRRKRVLAIAAYKEGETTPATISDDKSVWEDVVPESFNEALLNRVCKELLPSNP